MWSFGVPNVPCGVERHHKGKMGNRATPVPNVPCGVESYRDVSEVLYYERVFLMYRVELCWI